MVFFKVQCCCFSESGELLPVGGMTWVTGVILGAGFYFDEDDLLSGWVESNEVDFFRTNGNITREDLVSLLGKKLCGALFSSGSKGKIRLLLLFESQLPFL